MNGPADIDDTRPEMREIMGRSAMALALFDLEAMQFVEANAPACAVLGRDFPLAAPLTVNDLLAPADAEPAMNAMRLIADGTIDGYEANRKIMRADGSVIEGQVWVRSMMHARSAVALVLFMPARGDHAENAGTIEFPNMRLAFTETVAVGTMEVDTRLVRISAEIEKFFGEGPTALCGSLLIDRVHSDDAAVFLVALGRSLENRAGVGMHVRIVDARGAAVPVRILVSPSQSNNGTRFGIVIAHEQATPDRDDDRVTALEQHLWRIGLEVQASGVAEGMHRLPDVAQLPGLEELSTRQWQILTMLLRGDRVPAIARELYVGQSTVRSHLAVIFRKLGVHSQAELIELFRDSNQQNG